MANNTEIWILDTKTGMLTTFLLVVIGGLLCFEFLGADKSEEEFSIGVPLNVTHMTHMVSGSTEIFTEKGVFVVDSPISLFSDKSLSLKAETYTTPLFGSKRTEFYICQQENCIKTERVLLSMQN